MYANTVHYGRLKNLFPLFRRVTDYFTGQFISTIDGSLFFTGDPIETIDQLNLSFQGLELFQTVYKESKRI
jgi:hypothetical protein